MVLKLKVFTSVFLSALVCLPSIASANDGKSEGEPNQSLDDEEEEPLGEDIDDRFATEGYFGGYVALLQQTVPSIGLTGSIYLDDDFRFGADISSGNSEKFYGKFKTQNASVWGSFEISDALWLKGGLSYTRLERPTTQDPFSVLTSGEDKKLTQAEDRSDSLGFDLALGQLWSRSDYSISIDYIGFTIPALRLTGAGMPLFSLNAARVELLYNFN